MKLNNYQKIQISWGVLVAAGYILSNIILSAYNLVFYTWAVVVVAGLLIQFWLGKFADTKTVIIQLLWAAIVLGASLLTYLEFTGILTVGIHGMVSGWFFMCSGGMLITAVVYRFNISYIILTVLYALVGAFLAFSTITLVNGIYISAAAFLVLFLVDAGLESTPWRKSIAD